MSAGVFGDIKLNVERVIEGITPATRPDIAFQRWTDDRDLEAAAENSPGMVRRFSVNDPFNFTVPEVSDSHTQDISETFVLRVIYPLRTLANTQSELENIIRSDARKIDTAIGLHGIDNYVHFQHSSILDNAEVTGTENIVTLLMEYSVTYTQALNDIYDDFKFGEAGFNEGALG